MSCPGHYEAEVKDLATGAWWAFNDDACGAVDADGSRRADGTSAYVLVYLREDALDELAEDREDAVDMGMSAQGVPRALKDEILVENAVLRDAAAAAAASRATLAVDVRVFPGARTWRSAWPRDVSAAEALADARAALLGDLDGDAPEIECRLRAWDASRACGFGAPLPDGGAAADAGGGDAWVLEVRDVAGPAFRAWDPSCLAVVVVDVGGEADVSAPLPDLRATDAVADLRAAAARALGAGRALAAPRPAGRGDWLLDDDAALLGDALPAPDGRGDVVLYAAGDAAALAAYVAELDAPAASTACALEASDSDSDSDGSMPDMPGLELAPSDAAAFQIRQ